MTTTKTTKRQTAERKPNPLAGLARTFSEWLTIKDEGSQLTERQGVLRDRILDTVSEVGEEDDKGNVWIDLPTPITFTDHKGKTFVYSVLKKERHLIPANPLPEADLAEDLLREKGLWLTDAQEKKIRDIQTACPYTTITVEVDVDAVAGAYFKNLISEEEYAALLRPQKESFQFRPSES